jgi:hypothetical protein
MSSNSYFPTTESEQIIWLTNYTFKLSVHAADCGITEQELTSTLAELNYYIWMLQHWHPAVLRDAREATAFKTLMVSGNSSDTASHPQTSNFPEPPPTPNPGIQKRLFNQIVRIKAAANYNEAVGHDLGIIAVSKSVDHPVPEFTVTAEMGITGSRVRIDFKKYGHDGIWIETRTNGGDWVFLAIDTVKPYLDERPLAAGNSHETREYRLRWWDKSEPHGEWSVMQKAVLGG